LNDMNPAQGPISSIVQTPQTLPDCKNETNRRTELNVQN